MNETQSYHITGTLIAPNPIMGETRLWFDEAIWPAASPAEAADLAVARICEQEALDPRHVRWAADLQVDCPEAKQWSKKGKRG